MATATTTEHGVLIGFDGSDHAQRALHWAAVEAHRRELPLTVVTAFTVPHVVAGYVDLDTKVSGDTLARRGAEEVLEEARDVLQDYPGEVSFRIEYGDAAGVLVALSSNAELAIVGARGRGGFLGRLLGSVSSALPAHAHCPTVVVDRDYQPSTGEGATRFTETADERPISVGIDGSDHARVAALHAAQEAMDHGVPLRAVMAVPPVDGALLWYPELADPDQTVLQRRHHQLEEKLEAEIQWLSAHFADLVITSELVDGLPSEVMRKETEHAQLTVVGTRGRGAVASALLGSTSSGLLQRATGPVLVIPGSDDPRLESPQEAQKTA